MKRFLICCTLLALLFPFAVAAKHEHDKKVSKPAKSDKQDDAAPDFNGMPDSLVLIIRHAEKPESGTGLSPAGEERAKAYEHYFRHFTVGPDTVHLDALFSSADSKASERPRLTITPLSKKLKLPISSKFADDSYQAFVNELGRHHGKENLICWHHGKIPDLVRALGANPEKLLPGGKWPGEIFDWVIQLRYDHDGHLIPADTKRISEKLMPGDSD